MVEYLFYALFLVIPLVFYPFTSEAFEFNKIVGVYIFTTLICFFWIVRMVKERRIIFKRTIIDIPLILFLGSQVISTLVSIDTRTSLFGYYSRFNGGLLSLICFSLLYWAFVANVKKINIKYVLYSLIIGGFLIAIYGILEHFGGSISCVFVTGDFNNDCWVQDVGTRVFATLGQPNWLAAYLVALTPLALFLSLKSSNKTHRLLLITAAVLFFACIIFTKSRSGLLGLGTSYLIFWVFNFRKNLKLFLVINALLILIIAIFGTVVSPSVRQVVENQKEVQNIDQGEGGTESGDIRAIVWQGARDIWKANPFFGTGVETFGFSYWQFRPIAHNATSEWDFLYNKAHNEYLNFAANTGAIGLLSYLILIGAIMYGVAKQNKGSRSLKTALLAGFCSMLVTNFFGFSVVVVSLLFFLFPAITIVEANDDEVLSNKGKELDSRQKIVIGSALIVSGLIIFAIFRYWYADYMYSRSSQELQSGKYEASVKTLQKVIEYSPNEAIYHNQMAKVLLSVSLALTAKNEATSSGQLLSYALQESENAFSLSSRNMNVRQTRINIYLRLGTLNPEYARVGLTFIRDTILISPTDPKLQLALAKAYIILGEYPEARIALEKALNLKPDYEDTRSTNKILEGLEQQKK